ncbi:ATP-binding protein [Alkalisalibacterium limincola]|uniref:ATP-binding protein n=1 Tax=Alkalisalibacterium limincola TaxID=2699169 RepID=A0A5C8KM98_9GAMM|nr:ATP-binding protein [Alkalisalibacterium limincola]
MFASCQRVLADDRKLLVFDEVDHALNDCGMLSDGQTTAERIKGWLNDHLESNPVPTIWIANSIWHLNPALARRFDIIMEVKVPPTAQRVAMVQTEAKGLLDTESSRRLAGVSSLNPATLRRAARVVTSVKASPAVSAQRLERLIDRSLRAQHLGGLPSRDTLGGALEFDPSLVNAPVDLAELAAGLIHHPHARLLLHGPPGTGKTAFGRWLATRMDQPAIVKKASDLLGPFVGQTERLIARAFEEARDCKAILQIDEVENFLRARDQAKARWEASLVNEFLVQLESFPGVFVATTNLLGELDTAALRRFDAKIGFEWLQPNQAMRCLTQVLAQLELPVEVPETTAIRLRVLGTVTPGDFAVIARRHRFQPIAGAQAFVAALEEESQLKCVGPPRRVGFV